MNLCEKHIIKIISHPGPRHWDDFLGICLLANAQVENGFPFPAIEFRAPTPAEMSDPTIGVVDVGGVYDAFKNNFDHHQGEGHSSMWLIYSHITGAPPTEQQLVIQYVDILDRLGPVEATKQFGEFGKFPDGVYSIKNMPITPELAASAANFLKIRGYFSGMHHFQQVVLEGKGLAQQYASFCAAEEARRMEERRLLEAVSSIGVAAFSETRVPASLVFDSNNAVPPSFLVMPGRAGWQIIRNSYGPHLDYPLLGWAKACGLKVLFAHQNGFTVEVEQRPSGFQIESLGVVHDGKLWILCGPDDTSSVGNLRTGEVWTNVWTDEMEDRLTIGWRSILVHPRRAEEKMFAK